jgi:hypothetical protein
VPARLESTYLFSFLGFGAEFLPDRQLGYFVALAR